MTTKFDNLTKTIHDQIRKPMPKPTEMMKSGKDKAKRKDIKQGRKNWRYTESIKKTL
jgi:hypothetical protein